MTNDTYILNIRHKRKIAQIKSHLSTELTFNHRIFKKRSLEAKLPFYLRYKVRSFGTQVI